MKTAWPLVRLGDVLQEVSRPELIDPLRVYTTLGVRWYAQGLFAKDKITGQQIAASKIYRVEAGDFVYNRLFAWKGSFAVVADQLSNCFVSNEFPCFRAKGQALNVRYLHAYFCQEHTWTAALGLSSGATPTSRNRLKQKDFLSLEIPLPSLSEQKSIVARLDDVQQKLQVVEKLRTSVANDLQTLCRTLINNDPSTRQIAIAELVKQRIPDVTVQPETRYQFAGVYSFGKGVFRSGTKLGSEFAYRKLSRLKTGDITYPKLMAWEGALGIVPMECNDCVVSTEFPVFEVDQTKVLPEVFDAFFQDPQVWSSLQGGSTGTNARRRRLNPVDFLKLKIPVPSIPIQHTLAAIRQHQKQIQQIQTNGVSATVLPALLNKLLST